MIIGAVVGTSALVLTQSEENKAIRKKLIRTLKRLKEHYPDQINSLESVVATALEEAKSITKEMRQLDTISTKKPRRKRKKSKATTRTFVRTVNSSDD